MKIRSIQFFDYRAFYNGENDNYLIAFNNQNLLIYGENGSGKTSLYRGIKDFFHGNDFVPHNQSPGLNRGFIEVLFSDGSTERLDEAGNKPGKPEVLNTPKLNSFLSYKELLKTHFIDEDEVNLFDLLVNGVLSDHVLDSLGTLGNAWEQRKEASVEYEYIVIDDAVRNGEITQEEAKELRDAVPGKLDGVLKKFNDELSQLLNEINTLIDSFLRYFKQDLKITLVLEDLNAELLDQSKIKVEVLQFNRAVPEHHTFLNEARLSAIALSIYFAAIKSNPTQNAIKLLCLDDIFLGLDMGNRLPLLDILRKEFQDWQIILTTYDRHWFELARYILDNNKWVCVEMYAALNETLGFEVPLIYNPSFDYYQKAQFYFDKGSKDYPASGNYLRKEYERITKNLLCGKYLLIENSKTGETREVSEMGEIWNSFYSSQNCLLESLGFDKQPYQEFDTVSKSVLNPLSHDNLDKPIYKGELEVAFNLLEKIKTLEKIILLEKGKVLKIETYKDGTLRRTYVKLQDDIIGYRQTIENAGGVSESKTGIASYKVKPLRFEENGTITNLSHLPECAIIKAYDMVYHSVFNVLKASTLKGLNLYDEFIDVESGLSLELLFSSF